MDVWDRERLGRRFDQNTKRSLDGCHFWSGFIGNHGYGVMSIGKKTFTTHRVMFFLSQGYWPGLCLHTCGNRSCVNPSHLYDGTSADNTKDSVKHGTHWSATLTEEDRKAIRTSPDSCQALARRFGVSATTISKVKNGR